MKNLSIIDQIIKQKTSCYFISPHLDDAVYSAGSLISYLAGRVPVYIITVFTKASPAPYTFSAKRNLKVCGYEAADLLFADRRGEDIAICRKLGVSLLHLGLTDALWRKKTNINPLLNLISKVIPEAIHLYPFYRINVASNHIAGGDNVTGKLKEKLNKILSQKEKEVIFCPLAYDTHIDHIIVNRVCSDLTDNLIYWLDFPYYLELSDKIKQKTAKMKLSYFTWPASAAKDDLILAYKSQVAPTFPGGKIPHRGEYYFY